LEDQGKAREKKIPQQEYDIADLIIAQLWAREGGKKRNEKKN
jgi:hypothetical protein